MTAPVDAAASERTRRAFPCRRPRRCGARRHGRAVVRRDGAGSPIGWALGVVDVHVESVGQRSVSVDRKGRLHLRAMRGRGESWPGGLVRELGLVPGVSVDDAVRVVARFRLPAVRTDRVVRGDGRRLGGAVVRFPPATPGGGRRAGHGDRRHVPGERVLRGDLPGLVDAGRRAACAVVSRSASLAARGNLRRRGRDDVHLRFARRDDRIGAIAGAVGRRSASPSARGSRRRWASGARLRGCVGQLPARGGSVERDLRDAVELQPVAHLADHHDPPPVRHDRQRRASRSDRRPDSTRARDGGGCHMGGRAISRRPVVRRVGHRRHVRIPLADPAHARQRSVAVSRRVVAAADS